MVVDQRVDARVGIKLRELRQRRHLSLTHVAETVGVSKSMLSQVERGTTNASLTLLRALAQALEVPLFTLFVDDDLSDGLVRRDQRQQLRLPGSSIVRELLVPDLHRQIILLTARFSHDDVSAFEPSSHQGEECIVVLSGALEIEVGDHRLTLNAGDSYYFNSKLPHVFRNVGEEPTEIIAALSPSVSSTRW